MVDLMIDEDMTTKTNRPKAKAKNLTPSRGAVSHNPEDYQARAMHLYGKADARRIIGEMPVPMAGTVPAGADREAGN
jgi:hypothetical protein